MHSIIWNPCFVLGPNHQFVGLKWRHICRNIIRVRVQDCRNESLQKHRPHLCACPRQEGVMHEWNAPFEKENYKKKMKFNEPINSERTSWFTFFHKCEYLWKQSSDSCYCSTRECKFTIKKKKEKKMLLVTIRSPERLHAQLLLLNLFPPRSSFSPRTECR